MFRKTNHLSKSVFMASLLAILSACQSLSTTTQTISTTNISQPKNALSQALEHTLYRNQDWVAEHQLYFIETANTNDKSEHSDLMSQGILGCQQRHDDNLIKQMQHDHLKTYAQVAKLPENQRKAYETIKQTYLDCYKTAEAQIDTSISSTNDDQSDETTGQQSAEKIADKAAEEANKIANQLSENEEDKKNSAEIPDVVSKNNSLETKTNTTDKENNSVIDDIAPLSDLKQSLSILGLNEEQVKSINNFVAKSGKITTTGNYRPFSGYLAMQIDAGFENKNLKYHYRLPIVANWKTQAIYVKPDIAMPTVALYLDNKMGMSWQDKWYKFYPSASQKLPLSLTSKNWLIAFKDSIKDLPANQFEQVNASVLMPNIAYASQKIATNGTIIHWQQNAAEQKNLYQAIIQRYIDLMDKQIGEKTDKNIGQYEAWQDYKQKLDKYMKQRLCNDCEVQNTLLGQQLGQNMYFVLNNGQVKQIFANNAVMLSEKPVQIQTWITFDPDNRNVAPANQPQTLLKLSNNIHDGGANNNVLDGQQEIDRIVKLDKSRRLFGKDPEWLDVLKRLQKNHKDAPTEQDY